MLALYAWEALAHSAHSVLLQAQSDSPLGAFAQMNKQEQLVNGGSCQSVREPERALPVDLQGPTVSAAAHSASHTLAF